MRSLFSSTKPIPAPAAAENQPNYGSTTASDVESDRKHNTDSAGHQLTHSDNESVSSDVQTGVQKIEATTSVWTKTTLIIAYVM